MEHVEIALRWANRSRFRFGIYYDDSGRGQVLGLSVIGISPNPSLMVDVYEDWIVPKKFLGQHTKALRYIIKERNDLHGTNNPNSVC